MTGYNAVVGQTDEDPTTTASGAFSNPDIVAARSVDLADELPYGTVIAITAASSTRTCGLSLIEDKIGLRVIADSMHPRMKNKVDVMLNEKDTILAKGKQMNPALILGMCKNVQIAVVGSIDIRHMPKTQEELADAIGFTRLASK
jgi:3D (Asp-Asp-Asp) domain-containing protein